MPAANSWTIRSAFFAWLLVGGAACADDSTDQSAARRIIERAIAAQGGEEQVARLTQGSWRAKVKGERGQLKITGEIVHNGLTQGRISTSMSMFGLPLEVVVVT